MQKHIAFVTTSHIPKDDRIYYHLAMSLYKNGYKVSIISTKIETEDKNNFIQILGFQDNGLSKSEKVDEIFKLLVILNPDIIICSEPLPIIASRKFKKKVNFDVPVIYDITEWYPSKKNLYNKKALKKITGFTRLMIFNFLATFLTDAFIFGEYYKSLPYKILFPFKKAIKVGYYPDLEFINYSKAQLKDNEICLGYTGKITAEKGIHNFLEVVKHIRKLNKEIKIKLKIVGWFPDKKDETEFKEKLKEINEIEYDISGYQEFGMFSMVLHDVNIFFDLRVTDFENHHCLPIKLFYYMACGRPVIYSNLKAIRRELDVFQFGYLVDPHKSEYIAECILKYVNDSSLYEQHSLKARELAKSMYNWKNIEPGFLSFIASFKSK
jgi:glycosyltransferase involved in cell wall biosynthesis